MRIWAASRNTAIHILLPLVIEIVFPKPAAGQAGWNIVPGLSPAPYGFGVSFTDQNTGVCVGTSGSIHRSTDTGVTWAQVASGTPCFLRAVSFSGANGIAVGDFGTIVRTVDEGQSWEVRASGTTHDLFGVAFVSAEIAVAVGGSGTILYSNDGGLTWSSRNGNTRDELRSVSFVDDSTGVAVGGFLGGVIIRTTDGGTSWAQVSAGTINVLYAISFSGSQTGIAAGLSGTILVTHDAGQTWAPKPLPSGGHLFGVHCVDSQVMMVSGAGIFATIDGGMTWENQSDLSVHSMSFLNTNTAIAVGPAGILRTTTGGRMGWSIKQSGTLSTLLSVAFQGTGISVAVGDLGTIVRSTDGGDTWSGQSSGTFNTLRGVSFSPTLGVAVGDSGTILRTTDDGVTWTSEVSGTINQLNAVCISGPGTAIAVGSAGTILRSTDSGVSWSAIPAGAVTTSFFAVSFGNPAHGIAGGGSPFFNTVLRTSDGGVTWTDTSISAGVFGRLRGSSLTPSGVGFLVGGEIVRDRVLKTMDFGRTWMPETTGVTANLRGVFSTGQHNTTCVGGGPDFIILRTTDGGATWERQASPNPAPGLFNGVAFSDKNTGVAVGTFGLIVKTTTGGTVTSVIESGHPVPAELKLEQNYPNPFNPSTTIQFDLPGETHVDLRIYDVLGREVTTLVSEQRRAGFHSVSWTAAGYPTGVYFYRLTVRGSTITRKLLLLK